MLPIADRKNDLSGKDRKINIWLKEEARYAALDICSLCIDGKSDVLVMERKRYKRDGRETDRERI